MRRRLGPFPGVLPVLGRVPVPGDPDRLQAIVTPVCEATVWDVLEERIRQRLQAGSLTRGPPIFHREEYVPLFGDIMKVLHHVHSCGIVHRDIKPDNVFLPNRRDFRSSQLGDYGLSTDVGVLAAPSGPMYYTAPELDGAYAKPPGYRAHVLPSQDVFSTGIFFVQCVTGLPVEEVHESIHANEVRLEMTSRGCTTAFADAVAAALDFDPLTRGTLLDLQRGLEEERSMLQIHSLRATQPPPLMPSPQTPPPGLDGGLTFGSCSAPDDGRLGCHVGGPNGFGHCWPHIHAATAVAVPAPAPFGLTGGTMQPAVAVHGWAVHGVPADMSPQPHTSGASSGNADLSWTPSGGRLAQCTVAATQQPLAPDASLSPGNAPGGDAPAGPAPDKGYAGSVASMDDEDMLWIPWGQAAPQLLPACGDSDVATVATASLTAGAAPEPLAAAEAGPSPDVPAAVAPPEDLCLPQLMAIAAPPQALGQVLSAEGGDCATPYVGSCSTPASALQATPAWATPRDVAESPCMSPVLRAPQHAPDGVTDKGVQAGAPSGKCCEECAVSGGVLGMLGQVQWGRVAAVAGVVGLLAGFAFRKR